TPDDRELMSAVSAMVAEYREYMEEFAFHKALQAVWEVIGLLNRYIVVNAPWELAKNPRLADRLRTVLAFLAEALWKITLVLGPIMPETAVKMAMALGMSDQFASAVIDDAVIWGNFPASMVVGKGGQLFPRVEKKVEAALSDAAKQPAKKEAPPAQEEVLISFDQFKTADLRVAEIVAAEKVAKSDRLLKLTVKAPEERTIVAGIAQYYSPESLIGQKVIIVANLKPAKLMGIASQGMVLAAKERQADGTERLVVVTAAGSVAAGSRVA
ncbi:MAG: methionine--tRNA ligase subunit beta, partial [Desulfobulbus sp.]|nr:methionine--tRNA ligase subunit beta [Desulfobulbus sp.]